MEKYLPNTYSINGSIAACVQQSQSMVLPMSRKLLTGDIELNLVRLFCQGLQLRGHVLPAKQVHEKCINALCCLNILTVPDLDDDAGLLSLSDSVAS